MPFPVVSISKATRCRGSSLPLWRGFLATLVAVVAIIALAGCAEDRTPAASDTYFPITVGGKTVDMQLAITPSENQRGLMHRKEMPKDAGMLFLYDRPQRMSFWMKNTHIPLDIGFFTPDGTLDQVRQMYPLDENTVLSRSENLQFALEMNQGWFAENKVRPGATIDFEALAEAIEARGFEPDRYLPTDR